MSHEMLFALNENRRKVDTKTVMIITAGFVIFGLTPALSIFILKGAVDHAEYRLKNKLDNSLHGNKIIH